MTTIRPPCPVCAAKSGHHRIGCPAKGAHRGRKSKSPEDKFVRVMVSFPPEMADWLRSKSAGISQTIQAAIEYYRNE